MTSAVTRRMAQTAVRVAKLGKLGLRYHARRNDGYTVLAWRGGRYVELWKGKKSARECSSCRGLLVANALGKASVKSVYEQVRDKVASNALAWHFGDAKGGGTDFSHLNLSTLIVDLEQTFDTIGREIVFGWLADPGLVNIGKDCKVEHLISIGIDSEAVEKITTLIMEPGSVMQRWCVPRDAQRLLNCPHVNSWFLRWCPSLRCHHRSGQTTRMQVWRCDLWCGG